MHLSEAHWQCRRTTSARSVCSWHAGTAAHWDASGMAPVPAGATHLQAGGSNNRHASPACTPHDCRGVAIHTFVAVSRGQLSSSLYAKLRKTFTAFRTPSCGVLFAV